MILLQAGGNNAGFAAVAYACIFTPVGTDWGAPYPDPKGPCYLALEAAEKYIFSQEWNGLWFDARWIINQIFDDPKVKNNPNFRLFLSGYFQFFYDKGGDGDWCDSISFGLRYENRPLLSLALRKKINELIRGLNAGIKKAVETSFHPDRTKFIDIDSAITDGKFCQPGHNIWDQYWGDKVILWNMSPQGVVFNTGGTGAVDGQNNTYEVREPTRAEFDKWLETGRYTDDPREVPTNMSAIANAAHAGLGQADGVAMGDDPKWLDYIGPYQKNFPGMGLRPFHPKSIGYTMMARKMMTEIEGEYRDNPAKPPKTPFPVPHNTRSIQLLFAKFKNRYSWYAYEGPSGQKVNPCFNKVKKSGFHAVVFDFQELRGGLSLEDPPWVDSLDEKGVTWPIDVDKDGMNDCRFESDPSSAGRLNCNDAFIKDFKKDDSWNDGIIKCPGYFRGDEYWYHRAWVVEY